MPEIKLTYDSTFEGFLSLIYTIYQRKIQHVLISGEGQPADLFSTTLALPTDTHKASRVLNGLLAKSSKKTLKFIYECFLSEAVGVENKLLHLIRFILRGKAIHINDYSDPIIVDLHKVRKMVRREVHRMHAFVRFQETHDDIWACEINPDFNVLPLIGKHFRDRYPALEWLIIDVNRQYGLHHKSRMLDFVTFVGAARERRIKASILTDEEKEYQSMWKQYFKSVNIEERNNEKLHLRHVPRRYWKFLVEK